MYIYTGEAGGLRRPAELRASRAHAHGRGLDPVPVPRQLGEAAYEDDSRRPGAVAGEGHSAG
eukprot:3070087-Prymnesium_polylepis.3